jgi:octaprenyl-diphosphate synthase
VTLPLIHALRCCAADERRRVEAIVANDDLPQEDLDEVIALIEAYGGIDYTRRRAVELIASAKTHLAIFPTGTERAALEVLADYVVSRSH